MTVGIVSSAQAEVKVVERQEDIEQALAEDTWLRAVVSYEWGVAGWDTVVEEAATTFIASIPKPVITYQATVASGSVASVGSTVGECSGFVIPDYIIQRESGGNPSAYNPSGAYGCAQTLLSHYSRGSCQGLDPYSIQGQRDCVNILSNGGTNLNPWAQTR
jgi:hypothetical protein